MHQSTIFAVLTAFLLSAPVAPMPLDNTLNKRLQYGRGTWFQDGLGACGQWNSNSDAIVALSSAMYGSGSNCGRGVWITNTANGKSAYGTVRDECPGCGGNDLDMSQGLFKQLGDLNTGVLSISWDFA